MRAIVFLTFALSCLCSHAYESAYDLYKRGDLEESYVLFKALCDQDNYAACFSAANILHELSQKADFAKNVPKKDKRFVLDAHNMSMLSLFRKSCDGGYADGCNNFAYFSERLIASPPRVQSSSSSSSSLPSYLREDDGASSPVLDAPGILSTYAQACESGSYEACNNLGLIYSGGGLGTTESEKAIDYFGIACSGGNSDACLGLANEYYKLGDVGQAYDFFLQSCSMHNKSGCLNVGIMYERNEARQDEEETTSRHIRAMEYYSKACGMREKVACEYLQSLSSRLHKAR